MKKVLLTGGGGFLGRVILEELKKKPYEVTLLSRKLKSEFQTIIANLPDVPSFDIPFDTVIHLAGKAHVVPANQKEAQMFFDVNTNGTKSLLEALDKNSNELKVFIHASTIAVYGKNEGIDISEETPLDANTPYGQSKVQAEKLIEDWCESRGVKYFNLRLPLIVGNNPPGNLGQIIKAIKNGWYFRIKDNRAQKSMVLASDIASLVLQLEDKPSGNYNLSDGYHPSFQEVEDALQEALNREIKIKVPISLLKSIAMIGDLFSKVGINAPLNSLKLSKINTSLTVDDRKARELINWRPNKVLSLLKKIEA